MANSKLVNKDIDYTVPDYIIKEISNRLSEYSNIPSSIKQKAENIVKNKKLSYENLKRVKNFFDSNDEIDIDLKENERELQRQEKKNDYIIMGGQKMKNWVNSQLDTLRNPIQRSKRAKSNFAGFKNQFRKNHTKTFEKAPQLPKVKNMIKDLKPKTLMESEDQSIDVPVQLNFACVCLIFNEYNKLLLVRRSHDDDWMPNKFALVGGRCEPNEIPEETIIRETKEETNLTLKKPKLVYSTIEGKTFLYIFISKITNSDKIKLNNEHTGYMWVDSSQINEYDTVPGLMDMVLKAHQILVNNNR
jgi:8-oxo-dGTP pyrophosphatase MutT (NUDIX family)